MHAVSFMLKRGHLQTVAFGKKVVAKVRGMTPARFDLLYVLRRVSLKETSQPPSTIRRDARRKRNKRRAQEEHAETQVSLREKLGLHRSTVSDMLKELEAIGWVSRRVCETDRRTYVVSLTAKGLRKIWRAMRYVFRTRTVRNAYERIFGPKEPEDPLDLWASGRWKGGRESAIEASMELFEAQKRPGWDPFAGQTPGPVVLEQVYGTLSKIARGFGDRSYVWFHLGRGLPRLM